jgi:hypothetical protein
VRGTGEVQLAAGKTRQALFRDSYNGGASRDRTDGLVVANDALSQLSYSPTWRISVM